MNRGLVKVNKPMEVGVFVQVVNSHAPYYGRVGEIIKIRGTEITVRFGILRVGTYSARHLQCVEGGEEYIEKHVDMNSPEMNKLADMMPKDGIMCIMENHNMDYVTAKACYDKWRSEYLG